MVVARSAHLRIRALCVGEGGAHCDESGQVLVWSVGRAGQGSWPPAAGASCQRRVRACVQQQGRLLALLAFSSPPLQLMGGCCCCPAAAAVLLLLMAGVTAGYGDEVIFADGTFIDGSTAELSADGPIRPPFVVYCQVGLAKSVFRTVLLWYSLGVFNRKKGKLGVATYGSGQPYCQVVGGVAQGWVQPLPSPPAAAAWSTGGCAASVPVATGRLARQGGRHPCRAQRKRGKKRRGATLRKGATLRQASGNCPVESGCPIRSAAEQEEMCGTRASCEFNPNPANPNPTC